MPNYTSRPAFRGNSMTRFVRLLLLLALFGFAPSGSAADSSLRLATTTTTANSGLTDLLLPQFTAETGIPVQVIVVGSGKALRLGRDGEVDVMLVHAPAAEAAFMRAGHGILRRDVMYNDFVFVGPSADPAALAASRSTIDAMQRLHDGAHPFVSRGDDSGTHLQELALWRQAGLSPDGRWYREVGQGMGRTLQIANELDAYTLIDRGTWLAHRARLDISLLFTGNPPLRNPYGVIAVNPDRHEGINHADAVRLIDWLTSPQVQKRIDGFKIDGQQLFYSWSD